MKRDTSTLENKEFWEHIDKTANRVKFYPVWKRGGESMMLLSDKLQLVLEFGEITSFSELVEMLKNLGVGTAVRVPPYGSVYRIMLLERW